MFLDDITIKQKDRSTHYIMFGDEHRMYQLSARECTQQVVGKVGLDKVTYDFQLRRDPARTEEYDFGIKWTHEQDHLFTKFSLSCKKDIPLEDIFKKALEQAGEKIDIIRYGVPETEHEGIDHLRHYIDLAAGLITGHEWEVSNEATDFTEAVESIPAQKSATIINFPG